MSIPLITPETIKKWFISAQYIIRNFEDSCTLESYSFLHNQCFNKKELEPYPLNEKIDIINECIFKYEKKIKGEVYIENLNIPFQTDDKEDWIKKLYDISIQYGIYAPYLLYPIDIANILLNSKKGKIALPIIHPFCNEETIDDIFSQYGYYSELDLTRGAPYLNITIDMSNYFYEVDRYEKICNEIALLKQKLHTPLTEQDKKILNNISKQDVSKKIRSNSFYNRLVGIYIWDSMKCSSQPNTLEKIKQELLEKNLFYYNNNLCQQKDCDSCQFADNCQRSFRDIYNNAATSITERKIVPTSKKCSKKYPDKRKLLLDRVAVSKIAPRKGDTVEITAIQV